MIAYKCCEHCLDDPAYHEDYPPDSHDEPCRVLVGPWQMCRDGAQAVTNPLPNGA